LPGGPFSRPELPTRSTRDKSDGQIFIGRQATLAGALSIVSRLSIVVAASSNENATACTEIARAISSDTASLVRDPQNPTNMRARGARRRIRRTKKRARAGELVLISDRQTTEASLKKGK
jgi:hypothetical protein